MSLGAYVIGCIASCMAGIVLGFRIGDLRQYRRAVNSPVSNVAYSLYSGHCYIAADSDYHAARELIASLLSAPPATQ